MDIYLFIVNIKIKKNIIDFNIKESVGKFTKQNKIEKFSPNELIYYPDCCYYLFLLIFFYVYDFHIKWGKHT